MAFWCALILHSPEVPCVWLRQSHIIPYRNFELTQALQVLQSLTPQGDPPDLHYAKLVCQSSALVASLQTIVEGLGWPTSKPESSAGSLQWRASPVLRGSSQRSAEDELRYQTLTLQVVSRQCA